MTYDTVSPNVIYYSTGPLLEECEECIESTLIQRVKAQSNAVQYNTQRCGKTAKLTL